MLSMFDSAFRRRNNQPFINLEARFDNASIGLDVLTSNTYLMLVSSEPWVGEYRDVVLVTRS